MRWLLWFLEQSRSAALAPIPHPEPLTSDLFSRSSADDCEAFLTGRLAEYRIVHRQCVSASDWTNLLAHGTRADLLDEVAGFDPRPGRSGRSGPESEWRRARWYLAATILDRLTDQDALERVQQLVLVEVELELASDGVDRTPSDWVTEIEAALTRHQRSDHRSTSGGPGSPPQPGQGG